MSADNLSKTILPIGQLVPYNYWSMPRSVKYDFWSKKIARYDIRSKLSSKAAEIPCPTCPTRSHFIQDKSKISIYLSLDKYNV